MPYPHRSAQYPTYFEDIFASASAGAEVPVPCESPKEAAALRARLYAFSKALHQEKDARAEGFARVELIVRGAVLTARHRDKNPFALRVRAALEKAGVGTSEDALTAEAQASALRLLKEMEEKNKT